MYQCIIPPRIFLAVGVGLLIFSLVFGWICFSVPDWLQFYEQTQTTNLTSTNTSQINMIFVFFSDVIGKKIKTMTNFLVKHFRTVAIASLSFYFSSENRVKSAFLVHAAEYVNTIETIEIEFICFLGTKNWPSNALSRREKDQYC